MVWPSKKAQSNVIGFLLIVTIVLATAGAAYFWAFPLLKLSENQSQISQMENKLFEIHYAIIDVAKYHTQKNLVVNIKDGSLFLKDNMTIAYHADFSLPIEVAIKKQTLLGNSSLETGVLGADEWVEFTRKGHVDLELEYHIMNDTVNNQCYGIKFAPRSNAAGGPGFRQIYLKWNNTETGTYQDCPVTWEKILIEIE